MVNNVGPSQKESKKNHLPVRWEFPSLITVGTRRTKSSVKTNSGENSQHTSPRNKPYNTDYPRKDLRFETEGPTRKELKKVHVSEPIGDFITLV